MTTAVICPGCRTLGDDGRLDLRTLDRAGDALACECGRRYPIVDGIPIVLPDPDGYLRNELTVVEHDLAPDLASLLAEGSSDNTPYARLLEHLSTYLDAQWGDRAEPPPDGPGAGFGLAAFVDKLAALPRVRAAVELGCSVGRVVHQLALAADHVVGLDYQIGAVRRARRLLAGERLAYARRAIGRHYASSTIVPFAAIDNITVFCGDALDPPLVPRSYDRVVALNLLDSVSNPRQLLAVADGLCDAGGELILASPYTWQSSAMPEHHRIGGADPGRALRTILVEGIDLSARYEIVDEAELSWPLRRDARSVLTYQVDYLRARKR